MKGKRKPMSAKHSKKNFTKHAKKVHPKNLVRPMRGGGRL